MKPVIITLAITAAFMANAPALAQTQCAQFELIGNGARVAYQPFSANPTVETFDVRIRRLADGISGVRFLLVDTTPQPTGPKIGMVGPSVYEIDWLEDSTRRMLVVGNEQPQPTTGAQVQFAERSGTQLTRFRFSIPAGQQAPAQVHRENLTVRYQCLDSQGRQIGATQEQPASVELALTVPRYVAAYIGSAGQTRGTIDFGDVGSASATLSRAINITALSTLPFTIKFDSENGGLLKRRAGEAQGIIYSMNYAGVAVSAGDTLLCPVTPAPMGVGKQLEVGLDRASIVTLPAGNYRDTVTMTFTPRDAASSSECAIRRQN